MLRCGGLSCDDRDVVVFLVCFVDVAVFLVFRELR